MHVSLRHERLTLLCVIAAISRFAKLGQAAMHRYTDEGCRPWRNAICSSTSEYARFMVLPE